MDMDWQVVSNVGARVAMRYARRMVVLLLSLGTPVLIIGTMVLWLLGYIDSLSVSVQFMLFWLPVMIMIALGLGVYTGSIVGLWAGSRREWREINLPQVRIRRVAGWANIILVVPIALYLLIDRSPLSLIWSVVFTIPIIIFSSMFASASVALAADWIEEQLYTVEFEDPLGELAALSHNQL